MYLSIQLIPTLLVPTFIAIQTFQPTFPPIPPGVDKCEDLNGQTFESNSGTGTYINCGCRMSCSQNGCKNIGQGGMLCPRASKDNCCCETSLQTNCSRPILCQPDSTLYPPDSPNCECVPNDMTGFTCPASTPLLDDLFEETEMAQLATAGNNGVPSEAFPLGNCQGDCDDDDDCSVRVLILST